MPEKVKKPTFFLIFSYKTNYKKKLKNRERHALDNFRYLKSRSEVPCVMLGDTPEEDYHFIIHKKQATVLLKQNDISGRPIYIKFGNSEVRTGLVDFEDSIDGKSDFFFD